MGHTVQDFQHRLDRIGRAHARLSSGPIGMRIRPDGLIVFVPRRRVPFSSFKLLMLVLACALILKTSLFIAMGAGVYEQRVQMLAQGTTAERAGAWALQADPVTQGLAWAYHDTVAAVRRHAL